MPSPRSSGSTRKPAPSSIYQLKITLKDSAPPIWRRVQVSGATTLPVLHVVIQLAMGWEGEHLHQYVAGRTVYTEPMPGEDNFDFFEAASTSLAFHSTPFDPRSAPLARFSPTTAHDRCEAARSRARFGARQSA